MHKIAMAEVARRVRQNALRQSEPKVGARRALKTLWGMNLIKKSNVATRGQRAGIKAAARVGRKGALRGARPR